jgi:hypothetical protein
MLNLFLLAFQRKIYNHEKNTGTRYNKTGSLSGHHGYKYYNKEVFIYLSKLT